MAFTAASSSAGCPLDEATDTASGAPLADTDTLTITRPSSPIRRADIGYGGLLFPGSGAALSVGPTLGAAEAEDDGAAGGGAAGDGLASVGCSAEGRADAGRRASVGLRVNAGRGGAGRTTALGGGSAGGVSTSGGTGGMTGSACSGGASAAGGGGAGTA